MVHDPFAFVYMILPVNSHVISVFKHLRYSTEWWVFVSSSQSYLFLACRADNKRGCNHGAVVLQPGRASCYVSGCRCCWSACSSAHQR